MANIVHLESRTKRAQAAKATQAKEALAEAAGVLEDTIQSISSSDGGLDACHLAAVEKIKTLLQAACSAERDDFCGKEVAAFSLVEIARMAIELGAETFDGGTQLDYGHAINEALLAASAHLKEVAND